MNIKGKIFVCLLLAVSQSACAGEARFDEIYAHCKSETVNKNKKVIVDNGFISNIIDGDLNFERVNRKYVGVKASGFDIVNKHDPSITDHVVILNPSGNYFAYYKASDRIFPLCVSVEAGDFELMSGISIGQPLSVIKDKFKFAELVDVLVIQDFEGGNIVELYFDKSHRLKKITVRAEYLG